ncbi:MAG: PEP-CTERM sorting domain-containing protein [Pseudomonadota bacterium]
MKLQFSVKQIVATLGAVYLASVSLTASAVLIDGIEVGSGGNFHFLTSTIMERKVGGGLISAVGDQLEGVGQVTQIFDGANLVWSSGDNGRELTLSFSGYTATSVSPSHITFDGGLVSFYSDPAQDANFGTGTGFTNGNLWMQLVGTEFTDLATGLDSTLVSDGTLLGSSISGTGIGLLSVTGAGLADSFFDTNSQVALGTGNVADWEINSSFNNTPSPFLFGTHGTANISQNAVPEPASLMLVGLGLLGLAGTIRSRKS